MRHTASKTAEAVYFQYAKAYVKIWLITATEVVTLFGLRDVHQLRLVSNHRLTSISLHREASMPLAETEKNPFAIPAEALAPERAWHGTNEVDPRRMLVERIIESRRLGKSELLERFLRYVCDRKIRGRELEITEQQIGVRVFGRAEGYNSNDDNIVQNYARTLRKRLEDYFRREGRDEPIVLSIPRGGYVPLFNPRTEPDAIALEDGAIPGEIETYDAVHLVERDVNSHPLSASMVTPDEVLAPKKHVAGLSWSYGSLILISLLCASIVAIALSTGQNRLIWPLFSSDATRASHLLWSQMFAKDRDTFIVPADGGLVMMQSFTKDKVTLSEYINGNYRSDAEIDRGVRGLIQTVRPEDQAQLVHKVSVLAARRYTSVADLGLATRLVQLDSVVSGRVAVRFARDLRMDDLHTGNVILIGSSDANPWASLFEQQLNFKFSRGNEFGGSGIIRNSHPLPGEQEEYASITGDPSNATYGVIAYVPNLDNTGHILLIEGVNMAGTQAAGEFVLRPKQMQTLIEKAIDSQGRLQTFEILLKTSSIAANASGVQVLSERIHAKPGP
jgi:hypothetical protein